MRVPLLLLALVLPWCAPSGASAQVDRLYPVDEAARRPDFFSFRARLLQATQARDTAFLYAALAPDVLNSFGGDGGIAEFRAMWQPADPDSRVWGVLAEILSQGGAFLDDGQFLAPYVSSSFPARFDGYGYLAITGSGVRVREHPTTSSPVLATLSFDIVARVAGSPGETADGWTAVELADGRRGYVASDYARSPVDHRAGFVYRDGRWLLRILVAGD